MKRVAVGLLALGVLAIAGNRAMAQGALSYPMGAHVAAKYGIQHPGLPSHVKRHHARQYDHRSRYWHPGPPVHRHHHPGPVVVVPPVRRYPVVVYPPVYSAYPYYYAPRGGFSYHVRGISIGVGF